MTCKSIAAPLAGENHILSIVHSDRLQTLFAECAAELIQSGTHNRMFEHVNRCRAEYRSEYALICENIRCKRDVRELQQQLERDAEAARQRQSQIADEISGLKAEIDVCFYSICRVNCRKALMMMSFNFIIDRQPILRIRSN